MEVAAELMLRLAGTKPRRAAAHDRIVELAARADRAELTRHLDRERLLPLLGGRLTSLLGDGGWPELAEAVDTRREQYARRGRMLEMATLLAVGGLRQAGIRVATLKGPLLARTLHGDVGLRRSSDLDLLVERSAFHRACEVLGDLGWQPPVDPPWKDGLPLFESTLRPAHPGLPPIDLHWRVHWYEEGFSRRLLEVPATGDDGGGDPYGLATLLIFWARDGFWGLRHGTDIASWWDRFGEAAPEHVLEPIAASYPELAPTLCATTALADELLGVPGDRLLHAERLAPYRGALAVRLARWAQDLRPPRYTALGQKPPGLTAQVALVDWLLAPPGARTQAVRRQILVPDEVLAGVYRRQATGLTSLTQRLRYSLLVGGELAVRGGWLVWKAKGGRALQAAAR